MTTAELVDRLFLSEWQSAWSSSRLSVKIDRLITFWVVLYDSYNFTIGQGCPQRPSTLGRMALRNFMGLMTTVSCPLIKPKWPFISIKMNPKTVHSDENIGSVRPNMLRFKEDREFSSNHSLQESSQTWPIFVGRTLNLQISCWILSLSSERNCFEYKQILNHF